MTHLDRLKALVKENWQPPDVKLAVAWAVHVIEEKSKSGSIVVDFLTKQFDGERK